MTFALWSNISIILTTFFSLRNLATSVLARKFVSMKCAYFVSFKPTSDKPGIKPASASRTLRNSSVCTLVSRGISVVTSLNPLNAFVTGPVGSVLTKTKASTKPEKKLYGKVLGLKTVFAAARPIVNADPLIVPRYRRARSPCRSNSSSLAKKPVPAVIFSPVTGS